MLEDELAGYVGGSRVQEHLLGIEIEKIQELGWDFFNAIKSQDYRKRDEIWRLVKTIASQKEGVESIQEFFGGRRIGHKKDQITDIMAIKYVFHVVQKMRSLSDSRIKTEPLIFQNDLG